MANKKERTHGGKEKGGGGKKKRKREKEEQQTNKQTNKKPLSEKIEEARNVSGQRDKGWIHIIRVHDTTH